MERRLSSAGTCKFCKTQTRRALANRINSRIGKRPLLEGVALLSILAPCLVLIWSGVEGTAPTLIWFAAVFFVLGAVGNGSAIAQLGYVMEISPDDRRPAYSGYFNAIVAPAALSPLVGAALVEGVGLPAVFLASVAAAVFQFIVIRRLRRLEFKEAGV